MVPRGLLEEKHPSTTAARDELCEIQGPAWQDVSTVQECQEYCADNYFLIGFKTCSKGEHFYLLLQLFKNWRLGSS